jgi:hypothetical protein
MRLSSRCALFTLGLRLVLLVGFALVAVAGERVRFAAHFSVGETLRYRIETRTTATGSTATPIANPEGGSKSTQAVHLLVRLEVLDIQPSTGAASGAVRFRATYEKSSAESESDAFDLDASSLRDQYARVEGHSVEFAIEPGGQVSNVRGLEDVFPDRTAAEPVLSWLRGISSSAGLPTNGIAVGQKWKGTHPLAGTPLSGLLWRTMSTYLRNEPCRSGGAPIAAAPNQAALQDMCAVILTRFQILRSGPSNETPADYRRNGLRTSGSWTGSGESLDSVSLASGLLVSSTQSSTQDTDYEITSAATGSSIHRKGHVESRSEIALVPASP